MNINLEKEELNFILNVLGELPSKTGAWSVILKIKAQADAQIVEPEEAAVKKETVEEDKENIVEVVNG
tara:strand:- start:149 stop:352 length:204 start_codon:yes stop_codon:yes gene_type:complete